MTVQPSDSLGRTEQERREYLAGVVRLNPATDAERIVALRRAYHGLKESPPSAMKGPRDLRRRRERVEHFISRVRARFWQADMGQVRRHLDRLSLEDFPDLRLAVQRLLVVADHHSEFQRLTRLEPFAPALINSLKDIFTGSAREAAEIKDQLFFTLSRGGLPQAQHLFRLLRLHAPALYELEQDWMDILIALRSWHFVVRWKSYNVIAVIMVLMFSILVITSLVAMVWNYCNGP